MDTMSMTTSMTTAAGPDEAWRNAEEAPAEEKPKRRSPAKKKQEVAA